MRFGPALGLIAALTLAGSGARAGCDGAAFAGAFDWRQPQGWFGGLSGLELSPDGRRMIAITDRGRVLSADIHRRDGRIMGVSLHRADRLRGQNGRVLIGHTVDSEGLALTPDGSLAVSFERIHRVSLYDTPGAASRGLHRPAAFRDLPFNGGFEALAIDPAGRLIAVPENAADARQGIPLFRWQDGNWSQPFSLPADRRLRPVGADFGPDGRFYLLERGYNLFGFRARVRSWRLTGTGAKDERCELQTGTGTHDNLEGIALWRDDAGGLRLTMVSDDNFLFFQRTELVEYRLMDGLAYSAASR